MESIKTDNYQCDQIHSVIQDMSNVYDICAIHDIPDNGAGGFSMEISSGVPDIFIIRKNEPFHGYLNHCPHTGVNLNWQPDRFLNPDGDLIQCSTHGAQFRTGNGFCVSGPCAGRSLTPVRQLQGNGRIKLIQEFPA